jgi:hypothetical protein
MVLEATLSYAATRQAKMKPEEIADYFETFWNLLQDPAEQSKPVLTMIKGMAAE